jgi:hypothetical protein
MAELIAGPKQGQKMVVLCNYHRTVQSHAL